MRGGGSVLLVSCSPPPGQLTCIPPTETALLCYCRDIQGVLSGVRLPVGGSQWEGVAVLLSWPALPSPQTAMGMDGKRASLLLSLSHNIDEGWDPASPAMAVCEWEVQESSGCSAYEAVSQLVFCTHWNPEEVSSNATEGVNLPTKQGKAGQE